MKLTKRGENVVAFLGFIAFFLILGFCGYIETMDKW